LAWVLRRLQSSTIKRVWLTFYLIAHGSSHTNPVGNALHVVKALLGCIEFLLEFDPELVKFAT